MANDPVRRVPPTEGAPDPSAEQGPSTKTFSLKMEGWLMDSGLEAPVEIETAPAVPSPAAAPPPDAASPFASRPYHLFAAPVTMGAPLGAAPSSAPKPPPSPASVLAARPPTPVPLTEVAPRAALAPVTSPDAIPAPAASAVPPIPALAASAVPPIPGLAGGAPREAPRSSGLLLVGAGVVTVLVAAAASWFFWGDHIRALLKV